MGSLESWYSECEPQTRSKGITLELVRNAYLRLDLRPTELKPHFNKITLVIYMHMRV